MQQGDSSEDRIRHLEDELAALRAEMAALRAQAARPQRTGRGGHARSVHASGRRTLLKWAGAAAATAAVTMLATEQSANAAKADNGQGLIIGQTNTGTSTTILSGSGPNTPQLEVDAATGPTVVPATAIKGVANAGGFGVVGIASGVDAPPGPGPHDPILGTAVLGELSAGPGYAVFGFGSDDILALGVRGYASAGAGVEGMSTSGFGVVGFSSTGIDLFAGGNGRFLMNTQQSPGAPTTGNHFKGEMIRDSQGDIYICVAGLGFDLGVWRKVTTTPGNISGGSLVFLHAPFRIFDTRPGIAGCPDDPGAPMVSAAIHTVQVTNNPSTSDSTLVVPTGATGIVGDLICINSSGNGVSAPGNGFLTLQPHSGTSATGNSYLHYYADDVIQIYHNSYTIGLSADGKLDVGNYGATTNVGLDILGYII